MSQSSSPRASDIAGLRGFVMHRGNNRRHVEEESDFSDDGGKFGSIVPRGYRQGHGRPSDDARGGTPGCLREEKHAIRNTDTNLKEFQASLKSDLQKAKAKMQAKHEKKRRRALSQRTMRRCAETKNLKTMKKLEKMARMRRTPKPSACRKSQPWRRLSIKVTSKRRLSIKVRPQAGQRSAPPLQFCRIPHSRRSRLQRNPFSSTRTWSTSY